MKQSDIVFLVMVLLTAGFAVWLIWEVRQMIRFATRGIRSVGRVVRWQQWGDSQTPVVEYTNGGNQLVTKPVGFSSGKFSKIRPGDSLAIISLDECSYVVPQDVASLAARPLVAFFLLLGLLILLATVMASRFARS